MHSQHTGNRNKDLDFIINTYHNYIDFNNPEHIQIYKDNVYNHRFIFSLIAESMYWLNFSEIYVHTENIYGELSQCAKLPDIEKLYTVSETCNIYKNIRELLEYYYNNTENFTISTLLSDKQIQFNNNIQIIFDRKRLIYPKSNLSNIKNYKTYKFIFKKLFHKLNVMDKQIKKIYNYLQYVR